MTERELNKLVYNEQRREMEKLVRKIKKDNNLDNIQLYYVCSNVMDLILLDIRLEN